MVCQTLNSQILVSLWPKSIHLPNLFSTTTFNSPNIHPAKHARYMVPLYTRVSLPCFITAGTVEAIGEILETESLIGTYHSLIASYVDWLQCMSYDWLFE